jgi:helix-turn-helix protein
MALSEASQVDSAIVPAKAYLGAQLHKLRDGRGITRDAAADHLTCDVTKISRLETYRNAMERLGSSALEPNLTGGELEKAKRRLRST